MWFSSSAASLLLVLPSHLGVFRSLPPTISISIRYRCRPPHDRRRALSPNAPPVPPPAPPAVLAVAAASVPAAQSKFGTSLAVPLLLSPFAARHYLLLLAVDVRGRVEPRRAAPAHPAGTGGGALTSVSVRGPPPSRRRSRSRSFFVFISISSGSRRLRWRCCWCFIVIVYVNIILPRVFRLHFRGRVAAVSTIPADSAIPAQRARIRNRANRRPRLTVPPPSTCTVYRPPFHPLPLRTPQPAPQHANLLPEPIQLPPVPVDLPPMLHLHRPEERSLVGHLRLGLNHPPPEVALQATGGRGVAGVGAGPRAGPQSGAGVQRVDLPHQSLVLLGVSLLEGNVSGAQRANFGAKVFVRSGQFEDASGGVCRCGGGCC